MTIFLTDKLLFFSLFLFFFTVGQFILFLFLYTPAQRLGDKRDAESTSKEHERPRFGLTWQQTSSTHSHADR